MCLSKVYLGDKNKDKIVIEEVTNIIDNNGTIEVYSVFGESNKFKGYFIKEIDFTKNYTILDMEDKLKK